METRIKHFSTVETLRDYPSYAIDTEGNVWSFKYNRQKKLSPGFKRNKTTGKADQYVRLTDRFGRIKNFSVHRLVALAFLPTDDLENRVIHKNGNINDNRLENLEWKENRTHQEFDGYVLDDFLANKVKQVHTASIIKGLPVPDRNAFINSMIEGALESYIMQYGLRKLIV